MSLTIYNTLTRAKEPFTPLEKGSVKIYVCGVTVYDLCHIGHARSAVVFDMIARYFKFIGFDVRYARNVTDIDDKIIERASQTGSSWGELASRYTEEMRRDMDALGVEAPTIEPKATENIDAMIAMIEELIRRESAYEREGSVYFATRSFTSYGALSRVNLDAARSARSERVDESKDDPLDFALWKASKPGEPSWSSPWGEGRPGWHIECSAMSRKFLGETFDIHGGGADLIFPHHENEIAQSSASSPRSAAPARFWIHNGFVTVRSEKMSKSLGNFFTIRDLLRKLDPESIRLFLLSARYRNPIDFADSFVEAANRNLFDFYLLLSAIERLDVEARLDPTEANRIDQDLKKEFIETMNDDFNTPGALALFNVKARRARKALDEINTLDESSDRYRKTLFELATFGATLKHIGYPLGLFQRAPNAALESAKKARLEKISRSEGDIERAIAERAQARERKDFDLADKIRAELSAAGIDLHDRRAGTEWSPKFISADDDKTSQE